MIVDHLEYGYSFTRTAQVGMETSGQHRREFHATDVAVEFRCPQANPLYNSPVYYK